MDRISKNVLTSKINIFFLIPQEVEYAVLEEFSNLLEKNTFVDTVLVGSNGTVNIHRSSFRG